jgi:cytochrome bd-type quinol oxidase subunit 2
MCGLDCSRSAVTRPALARIVPQPRPDQAQFVRMKLLVIAVLLAILASLGSGLFFLVKDKDESRRVLRALTIRIALSVALFLLLIVAWFTGLIEPNATP